jgi:glycosyltransferase involved in cell wall biosynthesis
MRKGQNPAKMGLKAYLPKPLGVVLLSYIPSQDGYFAQSLEVLRYQIASLHATSPEFDLLVFDNGSCPEVQTELLRWQKSGHISFLFLSQKNHGKSGALNWCLASMPNEWICYADGDILFRPGWWEKGLEIMQTFPRAGLVTAQPCLYDVLKGTGQALHSLAGGPNYEIVHTLPDENSVREYGRGIGLRPEQVLGIMQNPIPVLKDIPSGVSAVMGASHMQFLVRQEVARQIVPLQAEYALSTQEDTAFNRRVDTLGFLHLSTFEPHIFHMGNHLDEITRQEIEDRHLDAVFGIAIEQPRVMLASSSPAKTRVFYLLGKLSRISFFNGLIKRLYNLLFEFFAG